jgi:hypothetical protein
LPLVVVAAMLVGLAIGSLADVGARSTSYDRSTDQSYGALATAVVHGSNQTGAALASLMVAAPTLPNGTAPVSARAQIQQGLDDAVNSTVAESRQAQAIASPPPSGTVAAQFAAVMVERADATDELRSTIDQLLGLTPLPVAGAPTPTRVMAPGPLISATTAAAAMDRAGAAYEHADAQFRLLLADIRSHRYPFRLPASVWVPSPEPTAPLGSAQLGATAPALAASVPLYPFHQLVLTAVGLDPPAVPPGPGSPSAGPGVIGVSCADPQSTPASSAPAILPPTPLLTVKATVTNCGTVPEAGIAVSASVTLSDPPGTAPPAGAGGANRTATVTLRAGGSAALVFAPVRVAGGHVYLVTVSIAIPAGQQSQPQGSTQQFLLQITG